MKTTMGRVFVLALGLVQGVAAADLDGEWQAFSKTATSITGNIRVAQDAITFGDGTRLKMTAAGSAKGPWAGQQGALEGLIYRLEPPADPALLNGNRLCGMPDQKVTYAVLLSASNDELSLLVFTGPAKPSTHTSACAIYNYSR